MPENAPKGNHPSASAEADDLVSTNAGLILPGGKVDPEAIQRAIDASGAPDDDSELRRVVFTLRRDLKSRLDKYLTTRITFMSRNQLQKLIDGGGVAVNGRQPKASTVLRAGDVVEVVVPPPPTGVIRPEEIPIDVLYEDDAIIVLNKRPDIIVHPARAENSGTLVNALAWHLRNRSSLGGDLSTVGNEFARPGVVHRLDRHTSGCIVFAKSDEAHWKLGHQFEHRRVDKRYLAIVQGSVEPLVDVIEAPIGPHPSREKGYREKYVVRHDELGKPSVTICRVRERYRFNRRPVGDQDFSLVELELKTGRTHQIRVHLSHTGYPIVGDDMYGGRPFIDESNATLIARQALHAATLGFTHPITEQPMRFTSPLRGDMGDLIRALRDADRVDTLDPPGATVEVQV
ncbi:MAG: RluA family pseudouridine synthase [Phycisphaeraceae bacterium]|nr:RluA family pseudouridine synthase [Phycisphaeraceae bacterium]